MKLNVRKQGPSRDRYLTEIILKNKIFFTILAVFTLGFSLIDNPPQLATAPQKTATATGNSKQGILSEARLRVVWVQEMGDGSDVDTKGGNLRLLGLDTGDGRGERVILGTLGNYSKPLITPRGDRVVYSDRIRKKVYVVNWDGSGLRELFGGFGLALWRDPRDGREWIYYGFEEMQKGGWTCPAVYRTLLDRPGAGELVWNRAPVNVDSFQLSADGQMAGGNFPWPEGGVAELPNKSIKIFTKGCWPALTTVKGKPFYWIFDGAHRNLTIFELQNNKRWQVSINGAPGIDGHEVYHPRWSNDPRIMAITGPYNKAGIWHSRGIEVYIGRFNADFTAIESWWQATRNDRADYFPDIWVAPAESVASKKAKTESISATPVKPIPRKTTKRLVVEARLTDLSVIPTPQDIAPYRRALLVNGYEIVRVISGAYRQKKIMAAHWVIEEGRVLKDAMREKDKTYRMVLERFDDHPELEGERLIMDSDEFKLPLFYELRK